ncbi:MAG TPA: porin family protein [Patescibacteria group bacterium]|nr:porin family protein [Patescibacteria group bacterium]
MKRNVGIFAVVAGLMFFIYSAEAQVSFGVKGGISIANQKIGEPTEPQPGELMPTYSSIEGFVGGAFVHIGIPLVPFSVQGEVLYTQKGRKRVFNPTTSFGSIDAMSTLTLNYLEIPVLAKFNIPLPAPVTPNLYIGPAVSFLLSSKQRLQLKSTGLWGNTIQDTTAGDVEYIQKNDFGLAFGGGVDFNLFATRVTLDARYTLGLKDVYKRPADAPEGEGDPTFTNRAWMVLFGVAF